jgi:glycosyltransferase involved in cell wall biosynthesis
MKTDLPVISVCMAVYNAEPYVAEAVESILNQTLGDFEFLIIDDGSTDRSAEILRSYAERDPRIRLTNRANRGLTATLNELLDRARADLIARMDADDIALPERFQRQIDYLRAHPECVLVGSRVQVIDPEGDPLCDWCMMQEHEEIDSVYFGGKRDTAVSHPAVMMRRDALLAVGKYRDFQIMEDVDLFLRLAEHGRLANLPEVLLKYRVHPGNNSGTASHRQREHCVHWEMIQDARRRRELPPEPTPPEPATLPPQGKLSELAKWAWWALRAGYVSTARKHARRLLAKAPFSPHSWKVMFCAIRGY